MFHLCNTFIQCASSLLDARNWIITSLKEGLEGLVTFFSCFCMEIVKIIQADPLSSIILLY